MDTNYVSLDEVKRSLKLQGTTGVDDDIKRAIPAACRAIDDLCDRFFYRDDGSNDEVRFYTPTRLRVQETDDVIAISELAIDRDGDGDYEQVLDVGDYLLEPLNAAASGKPFERIVLRRSVHSWPVGRHGAVRVTGRFGWPEVPSQVNAYAGLLAAQFVKRWRESPWGVLNVGTDVAVAARIARTDPQFEVMVGRLVRETQFA